MHILGGGASHTVDDGRGHGGRVDGEDDQQVGATGVQGL